MAQAWSPVLCEDGQPAAGGATAHAHGPDLGWGPDIRAIGQSLALPGHHHGSVLPAHHWLDGLLFHSDKGIEYSAYVHQDYLKARGIVPSMNRPRNRQDNAHMESFFHSLEAELTASVAGYIGRFYSTKA